jgi:alpha-amylase/alpha-mannosidase (GH57 family)
VAELTKIYDLFAGSWIDEIGSAPGGDLGTWIEEEEENRAWDLLGRARDTLSKRSATPETATDAWNVYRGVGVDPPAELEHHIVPHAVVWTFSSPFRRWTRDTA